MCADITDIGDEGRELLSDPPGYIRGVVFGVIVGGIFSVVGAIAGFALQMIAALRETLQSTFGVIGSDLWTVGMTLVDVLLIPLETLESVAAGAGPAAPVIGAFGFAVTAAITAAIIWGLFRVVRFI